LNESHFILAPRRYSSIKGRKKRKQNYKTEPVSDVEETSSSLAGLAGLYVLKVLFIDMTISLGDVCTDFWQVKYLVSCISGNMFNVKKQKLIIF
jgi:hypothetical protein